MSEDWEARALAAEAEVERLRDWSLTLASEVASARRERARIAAAIRAEAERLSRDYFTETALLHAARIAEAQP